MFSEHLALLPHPGQPTRGGEVEEDVRLVRLVGQPGGHPPLGSDLVPPELPLVALSKAEGQNVTKTLPVSRHYLLTTMGMGRVSMKTPQRAHRPQMNLPQNVLGWRGER